MSRGPRPTIPMVLAFYGVLALAALLWDVLRSGPSSLLPHGATLPWPQVVTAALAFAALVVFVSRLLERRFVWARRLAAELAAVVGPLERREIAVFASASAIAEEMFFRGPLQATLGIVAAGLIFGVCHGYFDRRFLPWTVLATIVGLGLGCLVELTGSLIAAVLAHFTVNYFEFHALDRLARVSAHGPEAGE